MGTAAKKAPAPEPRTYPSRRELRYRDRKNKTRNRVIIGIAATLLVVVTTVIVATSIGGSDASTPTVPYDGTTVNVVLGDYVIQGNLTAPAGKIRLQAINEGGIVHNVGVRGHPISGDMQPGKGFTLDVGTLAPGTYQLYCDIPGHIAKGMVANLVVT